MIASMIALGQHRITFFFLRKISSCEHAANIYVIFFIMHVQFHLHVTV